MVSGWGGRSGRGVLWPAGEGKPPFMVWDPHPCAPGAAINIPARVADRMWESVLEPFGVDSLAAQAVGRALSFGVHGDPWVEERFRPDDDYPGRRAL